MTSHTVNPALVYIFKPHDKLLASYWRRSIPPPPPPLQESQTSTFVCLQPGVSSWGLPRSSLEDYIKGTPGLDSSQYETGEKYATVIMGNRDLTSWLGLRRWVKFSVKLGAVLLSIIPSLESRGRWLLSVEG